MALSMEEQRILDAMERKLAEDDPRLASRLASLGAPRLRRPLRGSGARILAVVLAMTVIVTVTLLLYAIMPFRAAAAGRGTHARTGTHAHASAAQAVPGPVTAVRPVAQAVQIRPWVGG